MNKLKSLILIILPFISVFIFGVSSYATTATLTLSPNALSTLSSGANSSSQFMFNFNNSPYMIPALYDQVNYNLYQTFGYDLEDAQIDMEKEAIDIWTGQAPNPLPNPTLTTEIGNWLAQKFTNAQSGVAGTLLAGKMFFSQVLPNWVNGVSQNVRNYFIGELDSETGVITSVSDNSVHKITADEVNYFDNLSDTYIEDNIFELVKYGTPVYTKSLKNDFFDSSTHVNTELVFEYPLYLYSSSSMSQSHYNIYAVIDSSLLDSSNSMVCSGKIQYNNYTGGALRLRLNNASTFEYNGVTYKYGQIYVRTDDTPTSYRWYIGSKLPLGTLNDAKQLIYDDVNDSMALTYDYANTDTSGNSIDIEALLRSLIGKYVDAQTMDTVNSLVREFPVAIDTVDGVQDVVLRPTQAQYDELVATVEGVIADQAYYDALFELVNTYDDAIDIPEYNNNFGIDVPADFPNVFDSVGIVINSPNQFISIFEPIFEILGEYKVLVFPVMAIIPLFIIIILCIRFFI